MIQGMKIGDRYVGPDSEPLVIAEIGINHEGDVNKALRMVEDAAQAGCECVKFQCHIVEEEMIPNDVVPANADESIYEMMIRCALTEDEDVLLKEEVERRNMIYLSTPFSIAAADRLQQLGVQAFKIGSGECNNYVLIEHVADFGKPIILSTGMNNISTIRPAVEILRRKSVPFALMHCTSMYPTPYSKVRLGALRILANEFYDAVIGLSDHSVGIYTSLAGIALGARILEKHFTSEKNWPGPDIPISIDPEQLKDLIFGARAVSAALGYDKEILDDEAPTIAFAYASVVVLRDIEKGEILSRDNIGLKRPGTGDFYAVDYESLLGKRALRALRKDQQLRRRDVDIRV